MIGSDHFRLILVACLELSLTSSRFQFDASWLLIDGFRDLLASEISNLLTTARRSFGPMDDWHFYSYQLRKFLKGWGRYCVAEAYKNKPELLGQVSLLDAEANSSELSAAGWQQ